MFDFFVSMVRNSSQSQTFGPEITVFQVSNPDNEESKNVNFGHFEHFGTECAYCSWYNNLFRVHAL